MARTSPELRAMSSAHFGPMRRGGQRATLAVAWALSNCACQSALDLERFDFVPLDAGAGPMQTGSPLAPAPSTDDARVTPVRGPAPVPTPVPSLDGDQPATTTDAGSELSRETAPTQPPPLAPPAARPSTRSRWPAFAATARRRS